MNGEEEFDTVRVKTSYFAFVSTELEKLKLKFPDMLFSEIMSVPKVVSDKWKKEQLGKLD